jgi:hypothetical protein
LFFSSALCRTEIGSLTTQEKITDEFMLVLRETESRETESRETESRETESRETESRETEFGNVFLSR